MEESDTQPDQVCLKEVSEDVINNKSTDEMEESENKSDQLPSQVGDVNTASTHGIMESDIKLDQVGSEEGPGIDINTKCKDDVEENENLPVLSASKQASSGDECSTSSSHDLEEIDTNQDQLSSEEDSNDDGNNTPLADFMESDSELVKYSSEEVSEDDININENDTKQEDDSHSSTSTVDIQISSSEEVSDNDFNTWKEQIMEFLNGDQNFHIFTTDGSYPTWEAAASFPDRIYDPSGSDTEEDLPNRRKQLDHLLHTIASFCNDDLHFTIIEQSTSLDWIWTELKYIDQITHHVSGRDFLNLVDIKYDPECMTAAAMYDAYRNKIIENLKLKGTVILWKDSMVVESNEELSPTFEDHILLSVLQHIDSRLPTMVRHVYAPKMENTHFLMDFKEDILANALQIIKDLDSEDFPSTVLPTIENERRVNDSSNETGNIQCPSLDKPSTETIDKNEETVDKDEETVNNYEESVDEDEETIDKDEETIDKDEETVNKDVEQPAKLSIFENENYDEITIINDEDIINDLKREIKAKKSKVKSLKRLNTEKSKQTPKRPKTAVKKARHFSIDFDPDPEIIWQWQAFIEQAPISSYKTIEENLDELDDDDINAPNELQWDDNDVSVPPSFLNDSPGSLIGDDELSPFIYAETLEQGRVTNKASPINT